MIEYTTAERLAAIYNSEIEQIKTACNQLSASTKRLQEAFSYDYGFTVGLQYKSRGHYDDQVDKIIEGMKLDAWKAILQKLNIRRLMSSKRAKELDEALDGRGEPLPDISPETIIQVANGYAASVNEFLEEAVAEEYDFWRPSKRYADYKRNSEWKLNEKIIRPYVVERGYGNSRFRCNHHNQQHVTALDNIFSLLAGRGPVAEYKGPLVTAIEQSDDGVAETDMFKVRCHNNGNIHLTFKRRDLLELFNQIAAKNRIGV